MDVKPSFERGGHHPTSPHLHLPNIKNADLKITEHRKCLYWKETRLAVSKGFYTEYRRTLKREKTQARLVHRGPKSWFKVFLY